MHCIQIFKCNSFIYLDKKSRETLFWACPQSGRALIYLIPTAIIRPLNALSLQLNQCSKILLLPQCFSIPNCHNTLFSGEILDTSVNTASVLHVKQHHYYWILDCYCKLPLLWQPCTPTDIFRIILASNTSLNGFSETAALYLRQSYSATAIRCILAQPDN